MKRKIGILLMTAMVGMIILGGCRSNTMEDAAKEEDAVPIELNILAAASLTDAFGEMESLYKEKYPNVTLVFHFDSSGTLASQIREGAPADVFVSAAMKQMDQLEEEGLIESDSIEKLLENKVVLIKTKGSDLEITSFEDVATDKVSLVAIGNADVPVGQYTQTIYTNLGLWNQIQTKANLATNVRQVLDWVATGNVDCGIVYETDAKVEDNVEIICTAPEGSCDQVIYPMGIVKAAEQKSAAKDFEEFLKSEEAQKILVDYGFTIYEAKK